MSSTAATLSPELPAGNAQRAAHLDKPAASKILRVDPSQPAADKPLTEGTLAHMLDPLSIRFRAAAGDPAIRNVDKQKQIANALWIRLDEHLPKPKSSFNKMGFTFGVIFDQGADLVPHIDLICATETSCKAIRNELSAIVVDHGAQKSSVYIQYASRDSIPRTLVPIDVCEVALQLSQLNSFVQALEAKISKVGSLVGPIRTMVTKMSDKQSFIRAVRAFIELSDSGARLKLKELLDDGNVIFQWNSQVLFIMQLCRHLECYKVWAARHPAKCAEYEGREASSASILTDAPEDDDVVNPSGSVNKKRKSGGE